MHPLLLAKPLLHFYRRGIASEFNFNLCAASVGGSLVAPA